MKRPTILPIMVLLCLITFSCSTDSIDENDNKVASTFVVPEAKQIEIEILELINEYRLTNGYNALDNMDVIKSQAFSHTDYMVETSDVSHHNFFQRKNYLINNAGATKVSENVAYGFSSAQSVVNAWLNSPGHKENIEGDFTDFDISAEMDSEGRWYFTNIFLKK
ncbi:CAP domain-containing protein [Mangrovimonas cancribranchiae]|uniref:CAP domain-containing protein n=1 Tax=Mangrovimonas cancribranchiae TaxID=3080055 RepID=A0AAU6P355_9FLAO